MTPQELKAAHHSLGLSARTAAQLFQVSCGRTVRRWWCGERETPGPVLVLTRALVESQDVRAFFGVTLKD